MRLLELQFLLVDLLQKLDLDFRLRDVWPPFAVKEGRERKIRVGIHA
jgi:hypothetical protein